MVKAVYVVGDIHGMMDKLSELMSKIQTHLEAHPTEAELVFVGDYIDRGPNSKEVLEFVRALTKNPAPFSKVTALSGNHEVMMIDALDDLDDSGVWVVNGGIDTIKSFIPKGEDWAQYASRAKLKEVIGYPMIKWVRELPVYYEIGKIGIAHAGIDNELLPAAAQTKQSLIWSRRLRLTSHAVYKYTVHGHTPMKRPMLGDHTAYIDTGAVFGGSLTTLYIPDVENPTENKDVIQTNGIII